MSKIAFTIALPHDGPDGSRTPQFFVSCNNNTYLSMRGLDWKAARFGNSNVDRGWKNRLEYSVTASKTITKFSLVVNTSVVLPAMSWSSPYPAAKPAKAAKKERGRSRSSNDSSRSLRSSKGSTSNEQKEKPKLDQSKEKRRIGNGQDTGREKHTARRRRREQEDRVHERGNDEPESTPAEEEPPPRIQYRDWRDDKRPSVRWKEDGSDSSREGSHAKPARTYNGSEYRPKERRRKPAKVLDPGVADFMDGQ